MKKYLILIAFFWFAGQLTGQEFLTGIVNLTHSPKEKATAVFLPFYDSFSQESIYPNPDLWTDNRAFINNSYPVNQLNYGVATLDVLDSIGNVYEDALPSPFLADYLTSVPVRLDSSIVESSGEIVALGPADSVYFSFYYQPQGLGDIPATDDSLILQFGYPLEDGSLQWERVWGDGGKSLDDFYLENGTYFKRVMIPLTDEKFFTDSFRFRFFNYGSISTTGSWQSNTDQWHIDNVYLNKDRNINDIYYPSIDFVNSIPDLISPYTSMPYKHLTISQIVNNFDVLLGNTSESAVEADYSFSLENEFFPGIYRNFSGISASMASSDVFATIDFNAGINQIPGDKPVDSLVFSIHETLTCSDLNVNKERSGSLLFYNYFSLDDGSPEAGYGITPENSKAAYRFSLKKPDTLRGMSIYFNRTLHGDNIQYFRIGVWTVANEKPGNLIYESESFKADVNYDSSNTFIPFYFEDGGLLLAATDYYIGWIQSTNKSMNIGFDRNHDNHSLLYYNTDGSWHPSLFSGTVMIRPLFGAKITAVAENVYHPSAALQIYPNPYTSGLLTIKTPEGNMPGDRKMTLHIYDDCGKEVYAGKAKRNIDLSYLSKGLYIIRLQDSGQGKTYSGKILKVK